MSRTRQQTGFTIVELLIATLVFSLILVVMTVGVMSFTRAYYKGVTAASTQNAARTVSDEVSQAIQFSGLPIRTTITATNGTEGFCIGNTRYSYLRGWQLVNESYSSTLAAQNRNRYVFVRDVPAGGCSTNSTIRAQDLKTLATGTNQALGTELLSRNMRLSNMRVEPVTGDARLFRVTLRVVYGDADLLNNPTGTDATCRTGLPGNQFCAASELSTTVQRRIDS